MRRKTLVLSIGGALAAAAVVGSAIGASAAEGERKGFGVAPVTATPGTDQTGTPDTDQTGTPTIDPTGIPTGTPSVPAGTPGTTDAPSADGGVSSQRAVEIALAMAGGGWLDEVEREWEHGRTVWSVELVKDGWEIEVDVDATTGEVVKTDRDRDDDKDHPDDDDD